MKVRLEALRDEKIQDDPDFAEQLISAEDIEEDLLDEIAKAIDDQGGCLDIDYETHLYIAHRFDGDN